jgi:hypothetical protein
MQPLPTQQEQDGLLQGIFEKIPSLHDPNHLQELVILGLELILRRAEDQAIKADFIKRACDSIDTARQETVPSKFFAAVKRAAQNCILLLQTARDERLARDLLHEPTAIPETQTPNASAPAPQACEKKNPRTVIALTLLLATTVGAAIIAIATHSSWQDSPYDKRQNVLSAAQFTSQIFDAAAKMAETLSLPDSRINLHVIRDGKDQMIFVIDAVPRRICPASAWILAQRGKLTINGTAPSVRSKSAITALCYHSKENSIVTWSPNPS